MEEMKPMELLAVIQKVEQRGPLEMADRSLMLARQVWNYWLPTASNTQRVITVGLTARLKPYLGTHSPGINEPKRFADLLKAMHAYKSGFIVRTALYSLGFGEERSWHGFRASARTMMLDQLDLDPLAVGPILRMKSKMPMVAAATAPNTWPSVLIKFSNGHTIWTSCAARRTFGRS